MYMQDIGMFVNTIAISTLLLTLFMFLGNLILSCFEMPGQARIPQNKWKADNE